MPYRVTSAVEAFAQETSGGQNVGVAGEGGGEAGGLHGGTAVVEAGLGARWLELGKRAAARELFGLGGADAGPGEGAAPVADVGFELGAEQLHAPREAQAGEVQGGKARVSSIPLVAGELKIGMDTTPSMRYIGDELRE